MSSTLYIRKTPKPQSNKQYYFKQPIKSIISRKYYGHDGCGGGYIKTISPTDLDWFEGVLAANNYYSSDKSDVEQFEIIVNFLREGNSVDIWIEV